MTPAERHRQAHPEAAERRNQREKAAYRTLKAWNLAVYRRCVETAGVLAHNYELPLDVAAAIETALIELAIDLVQP